MNTLVYNTVYEHKDDTKYKNREESEKSRARNGWGAWRAARHRYQRVSEAVCTRKRTYPFRSYIQTNPLSPKDFARGGRRVYARRGSRSFLRQGIYCASQETLATDHAVFPLKEFREAI